MEDLFESTNRKEEDIEFLEGTVERILFSNDTNGYFVGSFKLDNSKKKEITIVGCLPNVQCGESLKIQGQWVKHSEYGEQYKVEKFESKLPSNVHGIRKYLGSGLIPGIGKTYADKIVDRFGEDTLRIISEESARLHEIPGIGSHRIRSIKKAWDEQKVVRDIMIFLQAYGVTSNQCLRIFRAYGNQSCTFIKENPYRIAREIHGIGFKTADKIALNLGFSNESVFRIEGGILFALETIEENGHTCLEKDLLIESTKQLLSIDEQKIIEQVDNLIERGVIKRVNNNRLQGLRPYLAEKIISENISQNLESESRLPKIEIDNALEWAESKLGFDLAPEQRDGIINALKSKIAILTGGPGTGKTTILRVLVNILKAKKIRVVLTAPTGRAAQRMKETTGVEAKTIHRVLKFDPVKKEFTCHEDNLIEGDFIIIDEASMLDIYLTAALIRAIPPKAHILFVGDIFQLPSVGPGNVLRDLIEYGKITVTYLRRIFRQGERSGIVTLAHSILEGKVVLPSIKSNLKDINPDEDVHFIQALDPETCVKTIKDLCINHLKTWYELDQFMDVQVLVPMHRGTAGISVFNEELQEVLNAEVSHSTHNSGSGSKSNFANQLNSGNHDKNAKKDDLKNFGNDESKPDSQNFNGTWRQFRTGDKVMQMRNNYDKNIFNGDLGKVLYVNKAEGIVHVNFNGETVHLSGLELEDVGLAYAMSIHKSQGSEFSVVILPLLKQYFLLLQRNLLYTALTRGRHKVFFVGDPKAYAIAIRNQEGISRKTALKEKFGIENH